MIKGKRLLVLSGGTWVEEIKKIKEKNNLTIIAAGDGSSPIFDIADEKYNIDVLNHNIMKKFIIKYKIDGVYLGGNERVIYEAIQYLNELKYPCYCTKKQFEILHNKKNFKNICREFGLPVVPEFTYKEILLSDNDDIFPVITKPVDGSGSVGFSVSSNKEEFMKKYAESLENSTSMDVIIEKFVDNESVVVFYNIDENGVKFLCIEDKYPVEYSDSKSFVAGMHIFESKLKNNYIDKFNNKVIEMLEFLDLKEGSLWIEVFTNGKEFYFNEVGYRYSGSITIYPINYFTGINQVEKDIFYALTGKSKNDEYVAMMPEKINPNLNYCIYSLHLKPGFIYEITGKNKIENRDNVVKLIITKNKHQTIKQTGTINQVGGFVHFVYDTNSHLIETIEFIHNNLKIKNKNNENLITKMIDDYTLKGA